MNNEDKKQSAPEARPNYRYLEANMYLVRTQAGLKQAMKHYYGDDHDYPNVVKRVRVVSFPALVSLSMGYAGYNYIQGNALHVSKILFELLDE